MNRDRRIESLGPFPLGELNMLLPIKARNERAGSADPMRDMMNER